MTPFSPGVVTVREKERALNSSFCLLRFTYFARRKITLSDRKLPESLSRPLPPTRSRSRGHSAPGVARRGPVGTARGRPGAVVSCAFTAPLPGFLGGTRAGLQGLDRKRDPCALPAGVPRGYRGSQASAPPDGAGLASSTGWPPRGWGSATIQEGPVLCERTAILGAACRAGEGGPEPRWARVSWGHPGQGLSVLPPGREAGAGRTARGGLGPRGPTVPPRCGVVSVTPNLVSLGQDPSFVRSTRSPGIFTSFLPHFVSVCCNRQETVRIRAPGAHDPGQPASDPDSGSGVRGPRVPPTIWPTAPRNLTFHPESRFPHPPTPPANKFSGAFLFFRKGSAFVSIR